MCRVRTADKTLRYFERVAQIYLPGYYLCQSLHYPTYLREVVDAGNLGGSSALKCELPPRCHKQNEEESGQYGLMIRMYS